LGPKFSDDDDAIASYDAGPVAALNTASSIEMMTSDGYLPLEEKSPNEIIGAVDDYVPAATALTTDSGDIMLSDGYLPLGGGKFMDDTVGAMDVFAPAPTLDIVQSADVMPSDGYRRRQSEDVMASDGHWPLEVKFADNTVFSATDDFTPVSVLAVVEESEAIVASHGYLPLGNKFTDDVVGGSDGFTPVATSTYDVVQTGDIMLTDGYVPLGKYTEEYVGASDGFAPASELAVVEASDINTSNSYLPVEKKYTEDFFAPASELAVVEVDDKITSNQYLPGENTYVEDFVCATGTGPGDTMTSNGYLPMGETYMDEFVSTAGAALSAAELREREGGVTISIKSDDAVVPAAPSPIPRVLQGDKAGRTRRDLMTSPEYIGLLLWFGVMVTPYQYYILSIGYQMEQKGDVDGTYTYLFLFFSGGSAVLAPLGGVVADKFGVGFGQCIATVFTLVSYVILLSPALDFLQILGMASFGVGSLLLFALYFSNIDRRFGLEHYGTLAGTGMLTSAVFSLLQYPLYTMAVDGAVDEVNMICAVAVAVCVPYTVWLSLKEAREKVEDLIKHPRAML